MWWIFFRREWRELRRGGLGRGILLLAAAAGVVSLLPPAAAAPTYLALLVPAALGGTARRLWRERRRGALEWLALSPAGMAPVLLAWGTSRLAALALLLLPPLAVSLLRAGAGPGPELPPTLDHAGLAGLSTGLPAGTLLLEPGWAVVGTLLAMAVPLSLLLLAVTTGMVVGLYCTRWSQLHLMIFLACALAVLFLFRGGISNLAIPLALLLQGRAPAFTAGATPSVLLSSLLAALIFLLAPWLIRGK